MFNIGVEGSVLRRHGDGGVGGADTSTSSPARCTWSSILLAAMLGGMAWAGVPARPEGEDRRPRGRDDDHDERHRDQPRGLGDQRAAASSRTGPTGRTSTSEPTTSRDNAWSGTWARCSASAPGAHLSWLLLPRDRWPRSSSGSSCGGPASGYEARAVGRRPGLRPGGRHLDRVDADASVPDLRRARRASSGCSRCWRRRATSARTTWRSWGSRGSPWRSSVRTTRRASSSRRSCGGSCRAVRPPLQIETDVPREFIIILQGILIMSVVITYQIAQDAGWPRVSSAARRRRSARGLRRSTDIEGMAQEAADDAAHRHRRRASDRAHVLHDHLPDRARRSVQRAIGHREHRPRGHDDHRDGDRRVGRALLHADTVGLGLPWGPILGLLVGMVVRRAVRVDPRARHGDVQGGPDRVGRRDQPRRRRARAVPVHDLLRAGHAVRPRGART